MTLTILLTKNLKLTFQAVMKNIPLFFLSIFIDLAFLFFFLITFGFTTKKIFDSLNLLLPILNQYSAIAQQIAVNPESVVQTDFSLQNSVVNQQLNIIASSAVIFVLILFIAWCILQSLNWLIANKMLKNKIKFFNFFFKFSLISFILFLIGSLILTISFDAIRRSMTSVMAVSPNAAIIASIIVFIIIFYFILLAYSLVQKCSLKELIKKIFIIGIKKIKYAVSVYLILIFILFLIFLMLKYSFTVNYLLTLILFLAVFLPYLAMSRVFLIRTMDEMEKEK